MSITFHCDGEGCDASAPPSTVTGGFPGYWTCKFVYEETPGGVDKKMTGTLHFCAACKDKRAGDPAPKPEPEPPKKATRKRAKTTTKKAPRKRAPKKPTPPEPVDDDEQVELF